MSWPRRKPSEPLTSPENAPQPPSKRYPSSLLGPAERADLADSLRRYQACEAAISAELDACPVCHTTGVGICTITYVDIPLQAIDGASCVVPFLPLAGLTAVDGGSRA